MLSEHHMATGTPSMLSPIYSIACNKVVVTLILSVRKLKLSEVFLMKTCALSVIYPTPSIDKTCLREI